MRDQLFHTFEGGGGIDVRDQLFHQLLKEEGDSM